MAADALENERPCIAPLDRDQPLRDVSSRAVWVYTTPLDAGTGQDVTGGALQDAGYNSADILAHCRGPGTHVCGCWVVDLVLGKE